MTDILLLTKLTPPPPRPALVARPRLLEAATTDLWVDGRFTRKLTLVAAPAGYGKTTFTAAWQAHLRRLVPDLAVAWLSLDERDDEPGRFLHYLAAALNQVDPALGAAALGLLRGAAPVPPPQILALLQNDVARAARPLLLVLEDFHLVTDAQIAGLLDGWLDFQPSGLHLVIVSRADPPLALPRLRVRGELFEVRAAQLRFTAAEMDAFFQNTAAPALAPPQLADLAARTEGWAAGLQLAALALRGQADAAAVLRGFDGEHRHVFDYLASEVLRRLPAAARSFLLATAPLPRFSAELGDAVWDRPAGAPPAAALLAQLETENLFLQPLDSGRRWFRYHHLFAQFLQAQLPAADLDAGRRRAAAWLAAHDRPADAVDLALSAAALDDAAAYLPAAFGIMMSEGQVNVINGWLAAFPEARLRADAQLAAIKAWGTFFQGRIAETVDYLQTAADLDPAGADAAGLLSLRVFVAHARGDVGAAIELAHAALEGVTPSDPLYSVILLNLAQSHWAAGDTPAAIATSRQAMERSREQGNPFAAATALSTHLQLLRLAGRRQQLAETAAAALAAEPAAGPTPLAAPAYLGLGLAAYAANDLGAAQAHVAQAVTLAGRLGDINTTIAAAFLQVQVRQARGDHAGALAILADLQARELPPMVTTTLDAVAAMTRLRAGDLAAAAAWARQSGLAATDTPHHLLDLQYLTLVRVLLVDEPAAAARLAERLAASAAAGARGLTELTATLLGALALLRRGQTAAGAARLRAALLMAAAAGDLRAFLDECDAPAPWLPALRAAAPAFVDALLAAYGGVAPGDGLFESLTEREAEILAEIAAGRSNKEIADRLIVSVGTVKTHSHNLYGKLGVRNRVEAVQRARELGLI